MNASISSYAFVDKDSHIFNRIIFSVPTRRSSDLSRVCRDEGSRPGTGGGYDMGSRPRSITGVEAVASILPLDAVHVHGALDGEDRKSTRLNSSHVAISYAVFCLNKNKYI